MITTLVPHTQFPHVSINDDLSSLRIYGEKGYATLPFVKMDGSLGGVSKYRSVKPVGLAWYGHKKGKEVRVLSHNQATLNLALVYNENALRHIDNRHTQYRCVAVGTQFKWEGMTLTKLSKGAVNQKGSWIDLDGLEEVQYVGEMR